MIKTSLGISNVTADRDEKGDIVKRKGGGVVAENKNQLYLLPKKIFFLKMELI